jgi:dolichol-phosphate mannosyltransferase
MEIAVDGARPRPDVVPNPAPDALPGGLELPELVFVLPAYNEEENLPRLLADFEARPDLLARTARVLIVDDGSQDGTADMVDAYDGAVPAEVIRLGVNQGPGAAFRTGFAAALERCSDDALIVTLESDTTSDLDALPSMLARAEADADLVLASWVMEGVSVHRRFLSAAAGWVIRHTLGLQATTVSSFFRVYRASVLRAAVERYGSSLVEEPGFACKAELLAKLTALGARVEEVDVPLDWSRRAGKSKMPVLRTMFAYWRMIARLRSSSAVAT